MDPASDAPRVGLLHPGAMGATVGATLRAGGADVLWASAGRSQATCERAREVGLRDVATLDALVAQAGWIVSVCPPHAAEAVASAVVARGFRGVYLDANAVAPERALALRGRIEAGGGRFVDGGIIGPPATRPGTTWLHLSGSAATTLAAAFAAGPLAAGVVSDRVGDASALKMCYAAFTKGSTALLAAQLAVAGALGVRAALEAQWERDEPGSAARVAARLRRATSKAWRFEGEMHEISATFAAAGLPAGFHAAAADVYARLARFRDADEPDLEAVLAALVAS
jgi:3-hydroxyisobutyrate dehydrogenase-like beta-hydroxyacid dehydrogenase